MIDDDHDIGRIAGRAWAERNAQDLDMIRSRSASLVLVLSLGH